MVRLTNTSRPESTVLAHIAGKTSRKNSSIQSDIGAIPASRARRAGFGIELGWRNSSGGAKRSLRDRKAAHKMKVETMVSPNKLIRKIELPDWLAIQASLSSL